MIENIISLLISILAAVLYDFIKSVYHRRNSSSSKPIIPYTKEYIARV